jgi:DNA-binding response OmpR family regulator
VRIAYLAEDRPDPFLLRALRDAGHVVEPVDPHGLDGARFDALVLDAPEATVEAVRRAAARANGAYVIALGAPSRPGARADLFRAGADACFARPVSLIELQARLEAQGRAAGRQPAQGRLRLLPAERAAAVDEQTIPLTVQEYRVLEALAHRPGVVLAAAEIVRLAWGEDAEIDPALVSTYVSRLRAKLGPAMIRAMRGHGYLFDPA